MKKAYAFVLLGGAILMFLGCPLESNYDLGSAMLPSFDARLTGYWKNMNDTVTEFLHVEAYGDEYPQYLTVYVFTDTFFNPESDDTEVYYARCAKLDRTEYLVLEYYDELWSEDVEYYFYQYTIKDKNTIIVKEANPSYEDEGSYASSEELKAYFQENQEKPDFLINETKYKRW